MRLLHDGAILLLQHNQNGSGSDLANYMLETYKLASVPVDEASLGLSHHPFIIYTCILKPTLYRPCC
ncbi:MAG: DUF410 domain-containing protein [Paenibacillus sp.]|nr:DUF410 domain-containing protein [Paenibacillus sp.]